MNTEELRAWIRNTPFVPSLVYLRDGHTLPVQDSSMVALWGDQLAMTSPFSDEVTSVSVADVVILEPLKPPSEALVDAAKERTPFKSSFRCWERLRLWYNGLLVLWTGFMVAAEWDSFLWWADEQGHYGRFYQLAFMVIVGAVFANVCFFAGPIVVGYAGWLGFQQRWLTPVLFVSGTLFTMVLALFVILSCAAPPM